MRFLAIVFALYLCADSRGYQDPGREIDVVIRDSDSRPIPNAVVVLSLEGKAGTVADTDATGSVRFRHLLGSQYLISVKKDGFQPVENSAVSLAGMKLDRLEFTLLPLRHKEQVDVKATGDKLNTSSAGNEVATAAARELPTRPATVGDALPLVPGVVRDPLGGLSISGAGEHRSALIVNSADVTDPATGQFGTTVPIDSVESLNVLQTPFLAEYGRFTAGLVTVDTRRGGDEWKWDLNDPLPDFRIRSYHLRGIRDATPRLNFEGPLIAGKLYFSEGFEYAVVKTPVITLPFPQNQRTKQGVNSFSQFDYVVSPIQLVTATFHFAPQRLGSVGLSTFSPQSTVPDAAIHDYTATISDKLTLGKADLLENTLSYTRFTAATWAHGLEDLIITPNGNLGNYFAQQQRSSARTGWLSTYSLRPIAKLGTHNFKAGAYFAPSSENGQVWERPYNIVDSAGQLLERVSFTGGSPVKRTDSEISFFAQDHWLVLPRLSIDAGVRAESQAITETLRLAPRLGIAWSPFADAGTILRAGIGLFYDRVPLDVFSFAQYPNQVITTYNGLGQVLQGPVTYMNALGQVETRDPFVFHENQVGDFSPRSTTWSFQLEQPITPNLKLRASYIQNQAAGLVIMNPVPPSTSSGLGTMLLTGDGHSRYRQFELTGRIRLQNDKQQLFVSYVRSHDRGDLNDFNNYLGNFPLPIVRPDQFSNLPADLPNRFLAWGLVHLPWKIQIAPIFEWRNGFPYLITNPDQAYVGVPYQQRYPMFLSFDARISKDFKVNPKYTLRFSVSSNNITNHYNPDSVYANTGAPFFGTFLGQHKRRFMADFDVLF
ncbi:MAG TPA: carboxypeptidase regulatory-like domain-containing protein [Bryobacteraceae bacterium]|nr:carboxypeptidase regulatory-like domain-containing protein [Bryobacteraceae bacterium]